METKKKKKKKKKFVKLGIFCLELGKNILLGIGNKAEFRPQNQVIESPDNRHHFSCYSSQIKVLTNI